MIILLYGSDTYRSRQKLNEIIENYKKIHKKGLNLKFFDEKDLNFEEVASEIQQTSIIAGKKMLILKNIFSAPDFKEKFLKNSKNFINYPSKAKGGDEGKPEGVNFIDYPSEAKGGDEGKPEGVNFIDSKDLILFYEEGEISGTNSLLKLLKKSGKSQEFKLLEGQNLKNWIKKEFKRYDAKTESLVIEKLINFLGNDSWQLSNEIKKLATYKKNQIIQARDVELLVKPKIDVDIFKTIDAIAEKNKKQALSLLHKHLEKGDSPLYLLSMINFQFRNLIQIKSLVEKNCTYQNIQKSTKLHPYVVKKSLWQIRKFSFPELKKIYQKIFKADINIKTGRIDPETALDLLITEI